MSPPSYEKVYRTHGSSFNPSIWYISMTGIADETFVRRVKKAYDEYQETHALRHLLKHLRQRRLLTPYQLVLERAGIKVEHPLVSQLHSSIVLQADWKQAERLLREISAAGLYETHLQLRQSHAIWTQLRSPDKNEALPSPRGGHAMCVDHQNALIYLFGGYDGHESLDDLWVYEIENKKWRCLSEHTASLPDGPGPRACLKMVHDSKSNSLYLLGRIPDSDQPKPKQNGSRPVSNSDKGSSSRPASSDFYCYDIPGESWEHLTEPATVGGPSMIFDHQMVIDNDRQIIYVSGGRIGDADWQSNVKCSGMYSYNLLHKKWTLLQHLETGAPNMVVIPPRFGHSMVLDPITQTLFLCSGQYGDKFLPDLYTYDINTGTAKELCSNFTASGGPEASFTQRAVINPKTQEIYVFTGVTRSSSTSTTVLPANIPCWVYRYRDRPGKWLQVVHESASDAEEIPISRFAQEVVYDPTTSKIYVHGGNAGVSGPLEKVIDGEKVEEKRLNDFWEMTLQRSSSEEVIRRATFLLRQQQFKEMCEDSPAVRALAFLQNEVASVVNHSDAGEAESFRILLTHLLSSQSIPASPSVPARDVQEHSDETLPPRKRTRPNTPEASPERTSGAQVGITDVHSASPRKNVAERMTEIRDPLEPSTGALSEKKFQERNEMFEQILQFINDDEKQPTGNLLDLFGINLAPC
ncbi:hypothetical protein AAF712_000070 [Marasmius tenuissimus]|uniref:Muskelin N-terminal domain-containing protein n=1 Tax=Marasmius tenuissimus TaxID=585030 RepID=A0ABR3AFF2_9AGAR